MMKYNSPASLNPEAINNEKDILKNKMTQLKNEVSTSKFHLEHGHLLALRTSNNLIWLCWRDSGSTIHRGINYTPKELKGSRFEERRKEMNQQAKVLSLLLQQI